MCVCVVVCVSDTLPMLRRISPCILHASPAGWLLPTATQCRNAILKDLGATRPSGEESPERIRPRKRDLQNKPVGPRYAGSGRPMSDDSNAASEQLLRPHVKDLWTNERRCLKRLPCDPANSAGATQRNTSEHDANHVASMGETHRHAHRSSTRGASTGQACTDH